MCSGGPELVLQRVDDPKVGKNRVHLDWRVADHDAEVLRLQNAGARVVQSYEEPGWKWSVMADPEENEFCVLQPTDCV
jgi:predicted enzyme related to lactoylglutathione lyase